MNPQLAEGVTTSYLTMSKAGTLCSSVTVCSIVLNKTFTSDIPSYTGGLPNKNKEERGVRGRYQT
jgi:hypothetical protein